MPPTNERSTDEGSRPVSAPRTPQSGRGAPLVIVSEHGRHSDESRRIVRAQAARASAAQSRVTRARNREGREGTLLEDPQSPGPSDQSQPIEPTEGINPANLSLVLTQRPLISWLGTILNTSATGILAHIQGISTLSPPFFESVSSLPSTGRAIGVAFGGAAFGAITAVGQIAGESDRPQLPLAVPRGFAALQQRIHISDGLMVLLSRTSCFDFGSLGVEERLHQLLFDLVISHARAILFPNALQGHSIQGHLRIACTCLTIFQGQRANGQVFAEDNKYQTGLEAAWSEATLLDQGALTEPKSAEASLWAVFIISVTTGSTAEYFHQLLRSLLHDLQLQVWSQVRNILLDFIYPVSFLDEPCKLFFDNFQGLRIGVA